MGTFSRWFLRQPASWELESWVLSERKSADGISLLRTRTLPEGFAFGVFKHRLSVVWNYMSDFSSGSPSLQEMDFMDRVSSEETSYPIEIRHTEDPAGSLHYSYLTPAAE